MIDLLDETLVTRIGWTLMHTMWQGCMVALLLLAALRVMKGRSAQARYLACCAALGFMVMAAVGTFAVLRAPATDAANPQADIGGVVFVRPIDSDADIIVTAPPALAPQPKNSVLRYVVVAWAIGVALMAMWHVAGWTLLLRLRRGTALAKWQPAVEKLRAHLRIVRRVAIIESTRIDVPAALGIIRPIILVPVGVFSGLSPRQVEAIIAHELAHIRRHDYLVNLLQAAIETLLFYHPATWWISSRIRDERENCCDDIAQSICGDSSVYASALAALEERRGSIARSLAPAATGGDLLNRVRRILKLPPTRGRRASMRSLAAAALAIACLALPLLVKAQQAAKDKPVADDVSPTPVGTTVSVPDGGSVLLSDAPQELSPITPADLVVEVQDYRMGAGDLVNVSITDLVGPGVETIKSARVSDTGVISMPLVGAVKLAGLTTIDAEKEIQRAYRDGNLIPNAQVSVNVAEARQRMIRVLGEVNRPGEYAMPKADFRILDALALAGARTLDSGEVRVVRAGPPPRTIVVPVDKLAAGDAKVNIVLRPGDLVLTKSPPKESFRVAVARDALLHDGKPITSAELRKLLEAIPPDKRRSTVLEVSAAAPDVTVERFFAVNAEMAQLVKELGLAYLSQTGVQAKPDDEKAPAKGATLRGDEFFINGGVVHPGAFTMPAGKPINVRQAIAAAGGLRSEIPDTTVTVIRRQGDVETRVLDNVAIDSLFGGKTKDVDLAAGDIVQVTGPPSGEYYMDGNVKRTGVYSLTARKITLKQALAAAGGLDTGIQEATITVIRRSEGKESTPVSDLSLDALLEGKAQDIVLQPNDIVRVQGKARPAPATTRSAAPRTEEEELAMLTEHRRNIAYQLDQMSKVYGPGHRNYVRAKAMLEITDRKIAELSAKNPSTQP